MISLTAGMAKAPGPGQKRSGACIFIALIVSIIISGTVAQVAQAALDEAWGTVTNVVDGDTFDVTVEKASDKVTYAVERVRLADVDSPEMDTEAGQDARDLTYAVLMNKKVFLDIDDRSAAGRDDYGRLICVAYLSGLYGQPVSSPSFNRILVDGGQADLKDFTNNEFNPLRWWSQGREQDSQQPADDEEQEVNNSQSPEENQSLDLERELEDTLKKDLLPRLQDSAERELDSIERRGWNWLKEQIGLNSSTSTK